MKQTLCLFLLFFTNNALFAEEKTSTDAAKKGSKVVDAAEILSRAEEIRNIESAILDVELKTTGGSQDSDYGMKVTRGAGRRAYVEFEKPASEVGRRMVVVGDRYWARFPDSRRVHPISRREMLGNSVFSLVDLFQFDAEKSYNVVKKGRKEVRGVQCYHLNLTAKSENVPYAEIDYYISISDFFPVEARFYSSLGRRIKTLVSGSERREFIGVKRPVTFTMYDDVIRGRRSVWVTKDAKAADIPEHIFSPQFLRQ